MNPTLTFQPFAAEHLDGALRLSREAGWPHRIEDWALLLGISKGVVAIEGETVVATAIVTPFGPAGMVNMIIVDQRMRGRGLGRDIMNRAMALIEPAQWRLVATKSGLPLYEKLGFTTAGSVHQHQGALKMQSAVNDAVRPATAADMPTIAALDAQATGAERAALMDAIAQAGRMVVLERGGAVTGYACLRPFGRGEVAGPVIAESVADAQALLGALLAGKDGAFIRVDTAGDAALGEWLVQSGLECVDISVAMTRGEGQAQPAAPTRFALAAQALG